VVGLRRSGGWSAVTAISGSHGKDRITLAGDQWIELRMQEHKEANES
jgi:hypothetical protein